MKFKKAATMSEKLMCSLYLCLAVSCYETTILWLHQNI